jgi:cytochrome d ubiquinol oxidase subunit I
MPWDAFPSALDLARFQFAFTVVWHFLFPAFTIGLASYLAVLEGLWLVTGRELFIETFKWWLRIFAVAFAMGVVSGIVMSYQFGTNWSVLSDRAGPVIGPLLGYEVLTAFFLEAGFLGVMLFGLNRVGKVLHFAATCCVAAGTLMSTFWIIAANSWMQTPTGHELAPDGRFLPVDWWAVIFNPSFPYRFMHVVSAAYLTTAFIVGAVGAWHLLRDSTNRHARLMFSMAMWMALIVAPAQVVIGDLHGLNTLEHQPQKVAAMEGHWEERRTEAPMILFAMPNMAEERNDLELAIPGLGSLILGHSWEAEIIGLKAFPPNERPTNVPLVFWAFRVMVGLGLLMVTLGIVAFVQRLRGRLYTTPWLHRFALAMGPSGLVAVTAGWIVTEAGRQPYTVYGLLRTAESVSPIEAPAVATSLALFIVVYFVVFGAGIWLLTRLMGATPGPATHDAGEGAPIRTAGITPAPGLSPEQAAQPGPAE